MQGYFKILRLFLVLILGVFFLLGCEDKPKKDDTKTDTSSQNEGTSNSDNLENDSNQNEDSLDDLTISDNEDSTSANNNQNENNSNSVNIPVEKTEYHEVFAERKLVIDIDVPYDIAYARISGLKHSFIDSSATYVDEKNKKLYYRPNAEYIGTEVIKIKFEDNTGKSNISINYNIDVKKPLLEGNRDFSIASRCQYKNTYLEYTRIYKFDIDVVNSTLDRIANLYDNKVEDTQYLRNPKLPRIDVDYLSDYLNTFTTEEIENAKKYHNVFKNNLDEMTLVTCNYTNGYLRSILPVNSAKWYAINNGYAYNAKFEKNDLMFYVSLLSELHTQVYLKEYQDTFNRSDALEKADTFMDKVFPNSHYKAEHQNPYYESGELSRLERLDYLEEEENILYYKKLKLLADTTTKGDIQKVLNLIAENYESFYMSGDKECKNSVICGTLFPEYTQSVTSNSEFKNTLEPWNKIENIDNSIGAGKIDFFPTQDRVSIKFSINRPSGSEDSSTDINIYQLEAIPQTRTIDDYFFNFDADYVHGDTASPFSGNESSGLVGIYTCFKDVNKNQLGCLSWSDHINKFYVYKAWGANVLKNNDKFYNVELYPIVRKFKHDLKEGFVETIALGATLKKYLPTVYAQDIKYIEYGMFATEFRNKSGGCKECIGKVIANKINLLKVK